MKWVDTFIDDYYRWLEEQESMAQKPNTKPQTSK